ncbi:SO2930 family diheme c-type cytochrome [uncultured Pseudomonas sp.]|uniref:SO2930 family diheme c-type cytochrome n=1 Tax=uncultured Pseudomonas sp. TaxID=114707 RepID=UPI0026338883|nr:SO2930 family diheme c-type cytochrome [uncultured Pseudomonas sp.]
MRRVLLGLLLLLLAGCEQQPAALYLPHGDSYPEKLSGWGLLQRADGFIAPIADALPYDLNTPLFTDYAHKLRSVWMPAGAAATYHEEHVEYPLGTVLSKTFYYPKDAQGRLLLNEQDDRDPQRGLELARVQLIETRLLLKQQGGWVALPYVWDEQQQEAHLEWAGDSRELRLLDAQGQTQPVSYQVPDANQCAGCHEERAGQGVNPLGPKARQLNKSFSYAEGTHNQLQHWQQQGRLQGLPADLQGVPQNALWPTPRPGESLEKQARSYLDANCSHCHNPTGPGRTSGLLLDPATAIGISYGLCKQPVAAGKGSGGRLVDIHPGQPEKSVLIYRLESVDPSVMMPELGRSSVHAEGVDVLQRWIASLPGDC